MSNWFYTSIVYSSNNLYIKGYKENGESLVGKKEFKPFLFTRGKGEYKGFNGEPLQKKTFKNYFELKEFVKERDCYGMGISSNSVNRNDLIYSYICDAFPEEITYNQDYICVLNYDIETSSREGFPNYDNPVEEIYSISCSVTRFGERKYYVFGTKNCTSEKIKNFNHYDNEEAMLKAFCYFVKEQNVDAITGWNSFRFDMPYLCSRITYKYNENWLKKFSPFDMMPKRVEKKVFNRKTRQEEEFIIYDIPGVNDLDMMRLYGKFNTYNGSLSLNNIANKELGEKKTDHSEYKGLDDLYENNYNLFLEYNLHDVELVDGIADKLKYIDLACSVAYLSKTFFEDSLGTIKTWDNLIYDYLLNKKNIIIPKMKVNDKDRQNRGGRVKDSFLGMSKNVVTTDATSLYPTIMMSLNISPETYVKKIDCDENKLLEHKYDLNYLKEGNFALASNGCIFDREKQGVIPYLVEHIFDQRVLYKNLMKKEKEKREKGDPNLVSKYDVFQYAFKILINSIYGAFSSQHFRYFDLDLAEAITVSGQNIIRVSDKVINNYLNTYLGNSSEKEYVVMSDTDSCAISLNDVVEKENPEDVCQFLIDFYDGKIAPEIEKSFVEFSDYCNFYQNKISFKREKVIDKMLITSKKRYGMTVLDNEGYRYDTPEMVVKGLEIVRSDTPPAAKEKLELALKIILTKTEKELQEFVSEFKNEYHRLPLEDIAFPSGVNGLEKYGNRTIGFIKGTPAEVKAALVHNDFVVSKGLEKEIELIKSGDKIKSLILTLPNPLFNDRFAVKYSFEKEFGIDKYIDYHTMFEKSFIKPLNTLIGVIGWSYEKSRGFADI